MSYEKHFKKMKGKEASAPTKRRAVSSQAKKTASSGPKKKIKAKSRRKQASSTPWTLVITLVLGTLLSFYGYQNADHVDDIISSIEIGFLGQATAQEQSASVPGPNKENSAAMEKSADSAQCAPVTSASPEELNHYSKLADRKRQLDLREQELAKMEEDLQNQKAEIEVRIKKLESIRANISGVLKERVEVDEKRVATLVDFYSNMKPKQAADVFNTLNEDLAIEVLGRMKKKNAAAIMNLLEPKKAKVLSEKFTGYKKR